MKVSADVEAIVDAALKGEQPGHDELVRLMNVDEFSLDAAYIKWAADYRRRELCNNTAEVHAQVGIDANPCSKNCRFCSFAASSSARNGKMEMPVEKIFAYAKDYVNHGANCLTFMITADYDFGQYLDYMAQVREAVGPDVPMTANMGDFTAEMAKQLKDVGFGSVYHAVRMGEGVVNTIPIDKRFETIQNAHDAGLKVLTCLEMIDPRWSNDEVATNMLRLANMHPQMCNAWGMVPVPGTEACDDEHYNHVRYDLYDCLMRLCCDERTIFGDGTLSWAEVGNNPRDSSNATEVDGIGPDIEDTFTRFEQQGFKTYRGPSKLW